jgi:hypothetical protein
MSKERIKVNVPAEAIASQLRKEEKFYAKRLKPILERYRERIELIFLPPCRRT